jgi:hypothetical protein
MYLSEMYRPDFRTINDFRKNHLSLIEGYFVEIVRICKDLGMVKVGEIVIDGSKMKANAAPRMSKDKASYEAWLEKIEKEIREILSEADQEDAKEDELYGEQRGDELPKEIQTKITLKGEDQRSVESMEGGGQREDQSDRSGQSIHEGEERGDHVLLQLSGGGGGGASDRRSRCGDGGE